MALTFTQVLASGATPNQSSYDTAAVTLQPNRRYVLRITTHRSTGGILPTSVVQDPGVGDNAFTLISKGGVDATDQGWDAASQKSHHMYSIEVGSATNNAVIRIDYGTNVSRCGWSLGYYEGYDSADPFIQVVKSNSGTDETQTSWSLTMAALTAGSAVDVMTTITIDGAITPEAGWTEDSDQNSSADWGAAENHSLECMHAIDGGDNTPSTTFSTAGVGMIGVEIRAAASATYEQEGMRARNDDGSETTATWIESQDTNFTAPKATNVRLRFVLNATGDPPSQGVRAQMRRTSGGGTPWKDVGPPPKDVT